MFFNFLSELVFVFSITDIYMITFLIYLLSFVLLKLLILVRFIIQADICRINSFHFGY
jgi:hypothetical protein